ncbi:uncharacterized protein LOC121054711 [Oryza brachyantha]|uniref:uncharacterized protein LOC121054711 n=1 Tax=Oryza brachyantha TaxID=4533 RepID=UPI001ADCC8D2|nr:uncharacterized protein LOC121054711 [Oryza brachyantha]
MLPRTHHTPAQDPDSQSNDSSAEQYAQSDEDAEENVEGDSEEESGDDGSGNEEGEDDDSDGMEIDPYIQFVVNIRNSAQYTILRYHDQFLRPKDTTDTRFHTAFQKTVYEQFYRILRELPSTKLSAIKFKFFEKHLISTIATKISNRTTLNSNSPISIFIFIFYQTHIKSKIVEFVYSDLPPISREPLFRSFICPSNPSIQPAIHPTLSRSICFLSYRRRCTPFGRPPRPRSCFPATSSPRVFDRSTVSPPTYQQPTLSRVRRRLLATASLHCLSAPVATHFILPGHHPWRKVRPLPPLTFPENGQSLHRRSYYRRRREAAGHTAAGDAVLQNSSSTLSLLRNQDRVEEKSIKPLQELTWTQTTALKLPENHILQEEQVFIKVARVRAAPFAQARLWCCWVFCLLLGWSLLKTRPTCHISAAKQVFLAELVLLYLFCAQLNPGQLCVWDPCLFQSNCQSFSQKVIRKVEVRFSL